MSYGMQNSLVGSTGSAKKQFTGDKIPSGYKAGQLQQFTNNQMNLHDSLFSHLDPQSYLSRLASGDQSQFGEIEAPAMRQFQELQGGIASRFSGMGSGARRSSGFQNATSQAASDFAQQLQSNRQGLQRQAIQDLMQLSHQLLSQKPYQRFLTEKPQSAWNDIAGKFASAIPGAISNFATGGFGGSSDGGSSVYNNGNYNSLSGLEDQFRTGQAY